MTCTRHSPPRSTSTATWTWRTWSPPDRQIAIDLLRNCVRRIFYNLVQVVRMILEEPRDCSTVLFCNVTAGRTRWFIEGDICSHPDNGEAHPRISRRSPAAVASHAHTFRGSGPILANFGERWIYGGRRESEYKRVAVIPPK